MSPQQRLHNMVLDYLYKMICKGKTNQDIFRDMERNSRLLPPMTNDELNALRQRFKDKEAENPEKMAEFRRRLKV